MMRPLKAAIIGAGARGSVYASLCNQTDQDQLILSAVVDPQASRIEAMIHNYCQACIPEPKAYADVQSLFNQSAVDLVFICSSDHTHKEAFLESVKYDCHILLEKPIATTLDDCLAIYEAGKHYTREVRMGFVLRHTPFYQTIRKIIRQGQLGKILQVEARELLSKDHGASYFRRWHRFSHKTGGLMNAKCSHDLDILNWLIGSKPVHVSAMGGLDYFTHRPLAAKTCPSCPLQEDCRHFVRRLDPDHPDFLLQQDYDLCVFNADKDIVDHEAIMIQYACGAVATFHVLLVGDRENRSITIYGSDARLVADYVKGNITVSRYWPEMTSTIQIDASEGGHQEADRSLFDNLLTGARLQGDQHTNEILDGTYSSLVALAGERSMIDHCQVYLPHLLEQPISSNRTR